MDASVKENVKSKKEQAQNIQEIKDTMKRSNIRIIELEEGESTYAKGTENIFNKIIEKKAAQTDEGGAYQCTRSMQYIK